MAAPARIIQIAADSPFKIKKIKVRIGQDVSKGTLLCLYTSDAGNVQKFKSCQGGTINNIRVKEGQEVQEGYVMFTLEGCTHPTVMKDMCASCGVDLRLENSTAGNRKEDVTASVAMVHSIPELIISEQMAKELGKADLDRLLSNRKLVLLVDLDQTIIHTTIDNVPPNLKGVKHFQLWHGSQLMWHHTKFRPRTQHFLEEISKLFELHICTFGSRMYAHTIAKLLDPEGKFFSNRILSRDECFNANLKTANLKALFPCGDSMVCIIDDREDVWNFVPNMVHVKPYRFFEGTADINAPPGLAKPGDTAPDDKSEQQNNESQSDNSDSKQSEITEAPTTEDGETMKETGCDSLYKEGCKDESENDATIEDKSTQEEAGNGISTKEGNEGDDDKENVNIDTTELEKVTLKETIDTGRKGEGDCEKEEKKGVEIDKESKDTNQEQDKGCVYMEGGTEQVESEKSQESKSADRESEVMETNQDVNDKSEKNETSAISNVEQSDVRDSNESKEKLKSDNAAEDSGKDPMAEGKCENKEGSTGETSDMKNEGSQQNGSDEKANDEEEIVWDDHDDYLFYLEDILKNIHRAFYDMFDQAKQKDSGEGKTNPSLKDIIPYIKKKVLKGCNIVFSGVIPTNMPMEKSRAYIMASALGANIQQEIKNSSNEKDQKNYTTHLIAARSGTSKVRTAIKYKKIKVVTVKWLWSCYERWERVEESLFLDIPNTKLSEPGRESPDPSKLAGTKRKVETIENKGAKKARIDDNKVMNEDDNNESTQESIQVDNVLNDCKPGTSSDGATADETKNETFSMTYNPLFAFSDDDLAHMDKEVEDEIEDGEESSEEEDDRNERMRQHVLRVKPPFEEESSEDSMTGDMPRGWGLKGKTSPKWSSSSDDEDKRSSPRELGPEYESETDQDKFEKIMEAFGPVTSSDEEYQESVGSVDEEIADAVMKEFLS